MKEKLIQMAHYLVGRLSEVSTWKGLSLVIAAGGWHRLDGSSKGELIAQLGMLAVGLIHLLLPDNKQYPK